MQVVITLTFNNVLDYEEWLRSQASTVLPLRSATIHTLPGEASAPEESPRYGGTALDAEEAVPDMPGGVAQTEAAPAKPPKKPRKPRKPRAKKETPAQTPAKTTEQEVLPVAPVTEAAPADGEKAYTLADSREVLTAYLVKPGNGAESLLKELKVHGAKRINEVPQEHIHGFLKRMVEAS